MSMHTQARAAAVTGLGATTLIHGFWAAGGNWPARSRDGLADLVYGSQPFPSTAATSLVAASLAAATGVVAVRSRPTKGASRWRDYAAWQYDARTVAAVLATRGVAGLVASGLSLGHWTAQYRRWDLRLYSPLCLGLAVAVIMADNRRDSGRSS